MNTGDNIIHHQSETVMEILDITGNEITLKILDSRINPTNNRRVITRSLRRIRELIREGSMSVYRVKQKQKFSMTPVQFVPKEEIEVEQIEDDYYGDIW